MIWSQIIRYVALVGQLALAVGAAAAITMVLKLVIFLDLSGPMSVDLSMSIPM